MLRSDLKQKGSALISALFIMTLVAIAATAMATRLQLEIYRLNLELTSDQMQMADQAVQFWAMGELANPKNQFSVADDKGKVLSFPSRYKSLYSGLSLSGGIYDLQSRLNLNNLNDNREIPFFEHFTKQHLTKLSDEEQKDLILAIKDWISPYDPERGEDPFQAYYLQQKPSYGISHQPMVSISELRLIKNVGAATYNKLFPFISVLPEKTPININTGTKEILSVLGDGLNESQVNDILQARGKSGFANPEQASPIIAKFNIDPYQVTLHSTYFLVISKINTTQFNRESFFIFKRTEDKDKIITLQLLWHSTNAL